MHPFAQIEIARARRRDLERSLDARIPPTGVAETPHTLEPVTPDPFIDDLNTPTAVDTVADGQALHERQRSLVLASLLACPERAKPTHRRWAYPSANTRL